VPAILLTAGIVGAVVHDPNARADISDTIGQVMPPLRGLTEVVLQEAARDAGTGSLLGLIALVWGASRFLVGFQEAIARVMGGDRRRGLLIENLGAFAAVILLIGALLASTALAGVVAFLDAGHLVGVFPVVGVAVSAGLALLPLLAAIGSLLVVYRLIPANAPSWRAIVWPAIVVGIGLTILARVFVFLAPRLVGSAALLGTLAAAFAALAWLALSFQALLIGAAWVRERLDRIVPSGAAPTGPASGTPAPRTTTPRGPTTGRSTPS
jgi:uncharacterized BrkB/YihY/UPF0761 family membrane protein